MGLHEISSMPVKIVEISSTPINGRRSAKMILHEIFPDDGSSWQKNGISWTRKYTEENMQTAEGMSITVEFVDGKPFGHGFNGMMPDGNLDFSDAVMVGYAHSPKIETLEVNGMQIEALTVQASLDEHRYPLFIEWLFDEINQGNTVAGSVEIVGRSKGTEIVYEGGWKEFGRIPSIYSYSGYALLGIESADPMAVLIELNSKKEEIHMTPQEIKDVLAGDFKVIVDTIAEVNSVDETEVKTLTDEISQLKAQLDKLKEQCSLAESNLETEKAKSESLATQLQAAENKQLISELNAALAEFNEEQRKVAEKQIEDFMKAPEKNEINTIVAAIKIAYADKVMAEAKNMKEQNAYDKGAHNYDLNSIFGSIEDTFKTTEGEASFY